MLKGLEKIIRNIEKNNELLTVCKEQILVTQIPLKQRDVTIKYLQMVMSTINENGLLLRKSDFGIKDPKEFLDSYSKLFDVNKSELIELLNDQHAFVNRWMYRSFMEYGRESLAQTSEEFYSQIAKRSILNSKFELISASKFFDLGTILKHMGRQTRSNWTELTEVSSSEPWFNRGMVTITRSTNSEHLEELKEYLSTAAYDEVLKQDCIMTESAYTNLFTLFGDVKARLHTHSKCEIKGDQACDYVISYTPVPMHKLLWRSVLFNIPTVKEMAKENEELKTQIFSLEEIISKKTERIESLMDRLKIIQKISMAGTKHSTINRVRRLYLGIEGNLVEEMSEHFNLLYDCSKKDEIIKSFVEEISEVFEIYSLTNRDDYTIDNNSLRKELEGVIDPNKKPMKVNEGIDDFLSAFSDAFAEPNEEESNEKRISELISDYEQIKLKYFGTGLINPDNLLDESNPDQIRSDYNQIEQQIVDRNPFLGLNILLQAENLAEDIIDSFEKNRKEMDQISDMVSVKESINYSINEAKRNRKADIDFEYNTNLNNDYLKTNRSLFETVVRDIVGNSIDANASYIKFELEGLVDNYRYDVCLTIMDDGSGMNQNRVDQLNTFLSNNASEHNLSTKQYGGEGTKILKDFIRLQNAKAEYSINLDKGTSIRLYFKEI